MLLVILCDSDTRAPEGQKGQLLAESADDENVLSFWEI
jgi:hypothetical protein